jgi:ZIP family zinc transporter
VEHLGASAACGLAVAASLLVGAVVAATLDVPGRLAALFTAFGGGALLSAVALELVPDADERAGTTLTALGLVAGTLAYVGADAWLTRNDGFRAHRRAAHAVAAGQPMPARAPGQSGEAVRGELVATGMVIDGIPESVALGLTVAEGNLGVGLLAGIVIANLIEAYGAAEPMVAGGRTKGFAVRLIAGIAVVLMGATVLGGTVLADAAPDPIGTAQAVAAGAVLAAVSIEIVPHAFAEVSRLTAAATVAGFVAGYLLT